MAAEKILKESADADLVQLSAGPSKEELEKKKQEEESKRASEMDETSKALRAAREELLQEGAEDTPPKDNTALQTKEKDSDLAKLTGIMDQNKEYVEEGKAEKAEKKASESDKDSKEKEKDDDKDENLAPPAESVAPVETGKAES